MEPRPPIPILAEAASQYARYRGLSDRTAGEELQRLFSVATPSKTSPGRYRYRNGSDGLDITFRCARAYDWGEYSVVAITVRPYRRKNLLDY